MVLIEHKNIIQAKEYPIPVHLIERMLAEIEAGGSWQTAGALADLTPKQIKRLKADYEAYLEDALDEDGASFLVSYYLNKSIAKRDMRWQGYIEAGGKLSNSGMWLLERRVGGEYSAPSQKVQQEIKGGLMYTSVAEAIEATKQKLGISSIEEQGDYWAKLQTAVQAHREPPKLPGDKDK
jgi:hypothetical protein